MNLILSLLISSFFLYCFLIPYVQGSGIYYAISCRQVNLDPAYVHVVDPFNNRSTVLYTFNRNTSENFCSFVDSKGYYYVLSRNEFQDTTEILKFDSKGLVSKYDIKSSSIPNCDVLSYYNDESFVCGYVKDLVEFRMYLVKFSDPKNPKHLHTVPLLASYPLPVFYYGSDGQYFIEVAKFRTLEYKLVMHGFGSFLEWVIGSSLGFYEIFYVPDVYSYGIIKELGSDEVWISELNLEERTKTDLKNFKMVVNSAEYVHEHDEMIFQYSKGHDVYVFGVYNMVTEELKEYPCQSTHFFELKYVNGN